MTLSERFWIKVDQRGDDECWPWLAGVGNAYGLFHPEHAKSVVAHRVAYELAVGPIPEGLTLDHLCKNTLCCNPAHLEPVTMRENLLRGDSPAARFARRTHCSRGHELPAPNPKSGYRTCMVCRRERERVRARKNYARQRDSRNAAGIQAALKGAA